MPSSTMHIFSSVLAIAAALIAAKEAKEFVDGDAGALDGRSLIAIGVLCAVAGALVFFANGRRHVLAISRLPRARAAKTAT